MDIIKKEMNDSFQVVFSELVEAETMQWFWDFRKQALFRSDKESRQLQYIMSLLPKKSTNAYHRIIRYKNKLVAIPVTAEDVMIYDMVTNVTTKIPLPMGIWNEDAHQKGKFGRGLVLDKYLILLPSWSNIICKIDLEQERIMAVRDISGVGIKTNGAIPFGGATSENEYIYMVAANDPVLIIINANTLDYSIKMFDHYEKGFCTIIKQREHYWLFPRYRGDIIKWNPETDAEERHFIPQKLLAPIDRAGFKSVTRIGNIVWLFPITAPEVLRVDIRTGKVEVEETFTEYSAYEKKTDSYIKYWMTKAEGSVLKVYSAKKGVLVQYDTEKNKVQELSYYLSGNDKIRYFMNVDYTSGIILNESMPVNLPEYITIIQGKDSFLSGGGMKASLGKKIYKTVME